MTKYMEMSEEIIVVIIPEKFQNHISDGYSHLCGRGQTHSDIYGAHEEVYSNTSEVY
jgi:hypothetical protein